MGLLWALGMNVSSSNSVVETGEAKGVPYVGAAQEYILCLGLELFWRGGASGKWVSSGSWAWRRRLACVGCPPPVPLDLFLPVIVLPLGLSFGPCAWLSR